MGGFLELAAICLDRSYRAWVYTLDGALRLINPDGQEGYIALSYNVSKEHWRLSMT